MIGSLRLAYTHYSVASKMIKIKTDAQDSGLEIAFNSSLDVFKNSLFHSFFHFCSISLLQAASVLEAYRDMNYPRSGHKTNRYTSMKDTCFLDWENWTQTTFEAVRETKESLLDHIAKYRWLGIMILISNLYIIGQENYHVLRHIDDSNSLLQSHFEKVKPLGMSGHHLAFLGAQDEVVLNEIKRVMEVGPIHFSHIQDWLDGIHK